MGGTHASKGIRIRHSKLAHAVLQFFFLFLQKHTAKCCEVFVDRLTTESCFMKSCYPLYCTLLSEEYEDIPFHLTSFTSFSMVTSEERKKGKKVAGEINIGRKEKGGGDCLTLRYNLTAVYQ